MEMEWGRWDLRVRMVVPLWYGMDHLMLTNDNTAQKERKRTRSSTRTRQHRPLRIVCTYCVLCGCGLCFSFLILRVCDCSLLLLDSVGALDFTL